MATWNVQGTFEPGALKKLVSEIKKNKLDIVALQETKQKNNEIMVIDEYTFLNSGSDSRILGTGFIISKEIKAAVVEFKAVSDRICILRFKSKYQKISLINVHAPIEDAEDEKKEEFYEMLQREYDSLKRYDLKIVLGDFNAKVGREEIFKPTIGNFSKHTRSNKNGKLMIDFARTNNMKIKSTYFERKEIYKGTWRSPDGRTTNQIDHVLAEVEKGEKNITNIRSYRGPDADSDHIMVGIKLDLKLPTIRRGNIKKQKRMNLDGLQQDEEKQKYMERISEKLKNKKQNENVENIWESLKEVIRSASVEIRGQKKEKVKDWYDKECEKALIERTKLRMKMLTDPSIENTDRYKEQRRLCKQLCRTKKRNYREKIMAKLETNYINKEIKNLYQGVKKIKQNNQGPTIFIKNKEGLLLGDQEDILERWAEYYEELLNKEETRTDYEQKPTEATDKDTEENDPPKLDEIKEIIRSLKNNKSPGADNIMAELFKYGGEEMHKKIHELICKIWEEEQMPKEWSQAIICPIHKKGAKAECNNYRGIALLNIAYKIMATSLKNRITKEAESIIGEYQCGFRPGRSVVDQLFVLREIQAESYEHKLSTHLLFIDFKQAYDRVNRRCLFQAMEELNITKKLVNLTKMTLEGTENSVKVAGHMSRKFKVGEGLRQGDPLSATLFNLALEKVIRNSKVNRTGTIYHKRHQCLAFADDLTIITRSRKELKEVVRNLEHAAQEMGLLINEKKTKYMTWNEEVFEANRWLAMTSMKNKTYKFEEVDRFSYLGTVITRQPGLTEELEARIMAGSRCVFALSRFLKSKEVSRKVKMRVYKTVIRPVVTYGSEVWTLKQTDQNVLGVWERKVLRRILGGIKVNGRWQRRTNLEVRELYQEPDIIGVVKAQRIRWLGHVSRMEEERVPNKALKTELGGARRRGRPKTRWKKELEEDLRNLGITNWKEKATRRKEWQKTVQKAMGLQGP